MKTDLIELMQIIDCGEFEQREFFCYYNQDGVLEEAYVDGDSEKRFNLVPDLERAAVRRLEREAQTNFELKPCGLTLAKRKAEDEVGEVG